jgi:uncharacterized protein (DUF1800 family)
VSEQEEAAAASGPKQPLDPGWAWAPYEPDGKRPWSLRWAGHLLRRAGFGADWARLQQALHDGPQQTVDKLLRPDADVAAFNRAYDEHETAAIDPGSGSAETLAQWWLRRMLVSPQPLLEKMTLFWHHHFGTSNFRVADGPLMQRHVQLLRQHALGRYSKLLVEIARDPATLLSLEADANRRATPNDRFARALLEHFSVGPGEFTEDDVRQAARAFTGWFVLRHKLRYLEREFDPGTKKILGQEGPWKGEDVVRIVLERPAAARLVVRSLYRWLIAETEDPPAAWIEPLAVSFSKDYDVARLVETMLRSNLMFSPAAYRRRIKSPVEYALGIVVALEGLTPTAPLVQDLAELGQRLGHPPTVHGWPGGRAWINPFTVARRASLASALLAESGPYGGKLDPAAVARKHGASAPQDAARLLVDLLLQGDLEPAVLQAVLKDAAGPGPAQGATARLRAVVHQIVTLPEFQLA